MPMRDPHVERLHYKITSNEDVSYRDPQPMTISDGIGSFHLEDGNLVVTLSDHYPTQSMARAVVDPYLRAWEISTDLTSNVGTVRFNFDHSDITDRNPYPPGHTHVMSCSAGAMGTSVGKVNIHVVRTRYPEPPSSFNVSEDVEIAYHRWMNYKEGKETLLAVASFILTMLEKPTGGRKHASKEYGVDFAVLKMVGNLSANKGDGTSARKAPKDGRYVAMTGKEQHWLETSTIRMIQRLGEHASGEPFAQITMADLPALS